MRAVFLNENLGGHATIHHHLAHALESDPRIDARFVDVPPPGPLRRAVGLSVPGLGHRDLDLQPLRLQLAASATARRLVRKEVRAADVLHAYTQNSALLLGATMARTPTVVTVDTTNKLHAFRLPYRHPTPWTGRMLPITLRFERRAFARAQLVVAQSEYAARSLRDDYGLPAEKVRVVRFGIVDPGGPLATPAAGVPVIAYVGAVMERKGGNALMRVHERHLADRADLTLITREEVRAAAGVRVINDIKPGDGRLWHELRSSALLALPSEIDYSPNAVLEAMSVGLPVVATRVGALSEIVEHGVTGFLVEPDDDDDLAHWLGVLVDDPELRARMGAAARAAFVEHWVAGDRAPQLVDVLQEAIDFRDSHTNVTLSVGVVIPTRDRCESVARIIRILVDDRAIDEIVIIDDGSADDTASMLGAEAARERQLRPLPGAGRGPACARQRGAEAASTDVVLFLDDDVMPAPGLAVGHRDRHLASEGLVVVGYMPVVVGVAHGLDDLPVEIYSRDYEVQVARYEADADNVLRDLWGGNVSMRREDAVRVGHDGPNAFAYHEDKDFGLRCAAAGLRGVFDRSLRAEHHVVRPFDSYLRVARLQGMDLVRLHAAHPELGALDASRIGAGLPRPARVPLALATVPVVGPLELRALGVAVRMLSSRRARREQIGAAVLARSVAQRRGVREAQRYPDVIDVASSRTERPSR